MPRRAVDERCGRDFGRLQIEPVRPADAKREAASVLLCRCYYKAQDTAVVPLITALVVAPPTYGYRRITATLNRQLRTVGAAPVSMGVTRPQKRPSSKRRA